MAFHFSVAELPVRLPKLRIRAPLDPLHLVNRARHGPEVAPVRVARLDQARRYAKPAAKILGTLLAFVAAVNNRRAAGEALAILGLFGIYVGLATVSEPAAAAVGWRFYLCGAVIMAGLVVLSFALRIFGIAWWD
jgi:hypothetical protein